MVALAAAVICKDPLDDRSFVLNYLAERSNNLTFADLMLHPIPIGRGLSHIPLGESILKTLLERSKATAIIYAGCETCHFPQHVWCVVLLGIECVGIVNGNRLFGAGYLFPILVESIENVSG